MCLNCSEKRTDAPITVLIRLFDKILDTFVLPLAVLTLGLLKFDPSTRLFLFISAKSNKEKAEIIDFLKNFSFVSFFFFLFSLPNERHEISFLLFPHFCLVGNEIVPMGGIPTLGQADLSEQHSRSLSYPWPKVPFQPACRNMPRGMSTTPVIICCQLLSA